VFKGIRNTIVAIAGIKGLGGIFGGKGKGNAPSRLSAGGRAATKGGLLGKLGKGGIIVGTIAAASAALKGAWDTFKPVGDAARKAYAIRDKTMNGNPQALSDSNIYTWAE